MGDPLDDALLGPAPPASGGRDPLDEALLGPRRPPQPPGMRRALDAYVPPEKQDEAADKVWWDAAGRQAKARLATADPITRTLTGVAAGFGDVGESIYAPLREAADAGDPEAAARLADFAARSKPGADAALRTGTDAALAALSVLGAGVGNFGKGAEILAKGGSAVRGALSAPIATTVLSGLQATPGGHKVLDAVPGAAKAVARGLGAEAGGKVEGAAGVVGAAAPALLAAWFGKSAAPQLAKTVASELGQVGIMAGGANIPQAVGVDPSTGAGMALGFAGTMAGQVGAGKVERGIVERHAQKGRLARELKSVASHIEDRPTPEAIRESMVKGDEGMAAAGAREADLEAAARPTKPSTPDPLAEWVEGPPKPPDEVADAIEEARGDAAKAAEYRKELDPYRARVDAERAAKDRAKAEEWGRMAAHDEAQAAWDALAPAERAAKVRPLFDLGVMRPGEAVKPWERLSLDQQEHIQAVLKDPSAFADAMPEEVAPGQPKGQAEPPAGEVPPPVPPPPAKPAAPVPDAPKIPERQQDANTYTPLQGQEVAKPGESVKVVLEKNSRPVQDMAWPFGDKEKVAVDAKIVGREMKPMKGGLTGKPFMGENYIVEITLPNGSVKQFSLPSLFMFRPGPVKPLSEVGAPSPVPDATPGKSVQDIAPAKATPFSGVTSPADSVAIQSMLIVNPKVGRGDVARILRDSMKESGTLPPDRAIGPTSPEVTKAWDDLVLNGKIDAEGNSLVHAEIARMRAEKASQSAPPHQPPPPTTEPAARPASLPDDRAPTVKAGGTPTESGWSKDSGAWMRGAERKALADRLRVAIRNKETGEVVVGEKGQIHADLRSGVEPRESGAPIPDRGPEWDDGFVDTTTGDAKSGYLTREQAFDMARVEMGEDLKRVQSPPETPAQEATPVDAQEAVPVKTARPAPKIALGNEVEIATASQNKEMRRVKGRIALMEAKDALPSHRINKDQSFAENEGYDQSFQPTKYHEDQAAQATTLDYTKNFDVDRATSNAPEVDAGLPTWDEVGKVANGNGRVMMQQEIYRRGGEKARALRAAAIKAAIAGGIPPEVANAYRKPILGRQVAGTFEGNPEFFREFAAIGNVSGMKRGSALAEGNKLAAILDDDILKDFGSDPEATFAEALNKDTGASVRAREKIVKKLPLNERNTYIDPKTGRLTGHAQDIIKAIALRKAGLSNEVLQKVGARVQDSVENAAVQIAILHRKYPDLNISKTLDGALDFYDTYITHRPEGQSKAGALADVLAQNTFGQKPGMDPSVRMVFDFAMKHAESPAEFRRGLAGLLDALESRKSLFAMSNDEMTAAVAKAFGVESRPGADWSKPGYFLGSGLGGLQKSYESLTPEQRRVFDRTLKGIVGGAAGYGIGDLTDERFSDDPNKRMLYRMALAGMGAYFGAGSPYWKEAWDLAAKGAHKVGVAKHFVNPRESISPEGAEVIRAADRRGSVANIDASVIAHGLPHIPDEILYPYLGGELGSAKAYQEHLATLGPEKAAAADAAVEAAKTVIRDLSKERAALGGISPESHGERYAGAEGVKVLEAGFLNRILMEKFAEGAKPSFFGAKANRPKLWRESVREDGHGAIVAIDAETVHEILQEAGIENPWMTRHGTVLQKGNNTLVKWAPTPEGAYQRDLFLDSLKDYARQQAEVMVGPGKTGGVGHMAQRLKDAPGLRVTLSRPQIQKMLGEYGIPAPESIEASGQRHAVRWADTPDGVAAADAFEVALRDFAQAESTVRLGKGASGGTSHIVLRQFDPLPLEMRKALGEVGFEQGGAKAQTFLTTARLGHQVANLKMYEGIAAGKDAKGEWTVPVPKGEIPSIKDPVSGEQIQVVPGPAGGEYVVVPGNAGAWGALAGKAVRKDWWDYLSVTKRIADSSEAWFQQFMGRWRAGKITTTRGLTRNFVGNLYFSHLAKTAPYFVDSLPHYVRVGRDFLTALRTGNLAPLRQYVEKYGIEVYPEDLTGDAHANETIRMVRDAAIDSTKLRSGAKGRIAGDIVTGGMLSEGIGKIPGPAVGGALGAAANVGYGIIKGEDRDDLLKRAAIGGAAGAGGNLAYRQLARAYGLTDAYFKAVAGETLVRRGMSLKDARLVVRERFQNFKEMTPLEETLSGRRPGAWQMVGLASNPFARFYTQLVRTTVNTARKDPAAAATGILLLPILAEGFEKGAGVFGPGQEEERRAAHNLNPSSIHYRRGGKLEKVDVGPILPWSDMAEDVRGLVTNDSTMGKAARDLFSMTLGGGPVAETIRAPMVLSGGPETKDLRSGFPIGEPGESSGDAFARTLMQTWFHPSTPGAGTDWKRAEEQITEKVKKGSRKQPLEPGRTALALGLGMNTGAVDFDKTLRQLRVQRDREFEAAERRIDRALNDQQFRSDPEKVKRQRTLYREEIAAAKKRFEEARARLTPQTGTK